MFFLSLPLIGHLHLLSTNHSDKLHSGLKVLLECGWFDMEFQPKSYTKSVF